MELWMKTNSGASAMWKSMSNSKVYESNEEEKAKKKFVVL